MRGSEDVRGPDDREDEPAQVGTTQKRGFKRKAEEQTSTRDMGKFFWEKPFVCSGG